MSPFKKPKDVAAVAPSIVLLDPRYPHNVGAAVRACSCFGVGQVWLTGSRVADQVLSAQRLPREERMKGFADVQLVLDDRPFEHFKGVVPVAVELLDNSENLLTFEHPENAVYVFGPEDGSIPPVVRKLCHRRVFIPTRHCTNLGAAVYLMLYDRMMKAHRAGTVLALPIESTLAEHRSGWAVDDDPAFT
jgi:tRNA(Leu) C34 or U34 (ribose-2'-O)-methylase TrmL